MNELIEIFTIGGIVGIMCYVLVLLFNSQYQWIVTGLFLIIGLAMLYAVGEYLIKSEPSQKTVQPQYGCISGECVNGYGLYKFSSGGYYQGVFKDGNWHGVGELVFSSGDKYLGYWKDNEKHGHGKYTWADGDVYNGNWANSLKHGEGSDIFTNGSRWDGIYVNGVRDGRGVQTYTDGTRRTTFYEDGKNYCEKNYMWKIIKCPNPQ